MRITAPLKLQGIVIPIGWEPNGSVSALAIATYDEKIINITPNDIGHQLISLLRQRVVIEGFLLQSQDQSTFQVECFRMDQSSPFKSHLHDTDRYTPQHHFRL